MHTPFPLRALPSRLPPLSALPSWWPGPMALSSLLRCLPGRYPAHCQILRLGPAPACSVLSCWYGLPGVEWGDLDRKHSHEVVYATVHMHAVVLPPFSRRIPLSRGSAESVQSASPLPIERTWRGS